MRSSLSCSVFGVKRLLVILPAAVLLTSCTVMDIVGPRANGEIMTLARQASADQFSLDDAAAADEIFSVLMGEDVEARRSFITRNAKDVRCLDV